MYKRTLEKYYNCSNHIALVHNFIRSNASIHKKIRVLLQSYTNGKFATVSLLINVRNAAAMKLHRSVSTSIRFLILILIKDIAKLLSHK